MNDEGRDGDEVARMALESNCIPPEPGSYEVLVRANDFSRRPGSSFRTTVVIE